jgi:hypothetical protein
MKLLDPVGYEELESAWTFISSTTDYAAELVTEAWLDPSGAKVILYRQYGLTRCKRYRVMGL